MELIKFNISDRKNKKYVAVFSNPKKTIHFGFKGSSTYLDHKDKDKRDAYRVRHIVNENWNDVNAGSLARFVLWGSKTNLQDALKSYLKRFDIKDNR
tara:strand:- start:589 stop:879 length:291 start_codon:yes stop_codon:yes gene_type:complete